MSVLAWMFLTALAVVPAVALLSMVANAIERRVTAWRNARRRRAFERRFRKDSPTNPTITFE
jgi:hypothetical protein